MYVFRYSLKPWFQEILASLNIYLIVLEVLDELSLNTLWKVSVIVV